MNIALDGGLRLAGSRRRIPAGAPLSAIRHLAGAGVLRHGGRHRAPRRQLVAASRRTPGARRPHRGHGAGRRPGASCWPARPYLLARLFNYSQTFLSGQTHEYGTTLLVLAGLFNLLALADALELRKAKQA